MNFKVKFKEEAPSFKAKFGWNNGEFEAGKKSEYDTFWDAYQDNGNRTEYGGAFCGRGWNATTFRPKYPIVLMPAYNGNSDVFKYFDRANTSLTNLVDLSLFDIDWSNCDNFTNTFMEAKLENAGFIDTSCATRMVSTFSAGNVGGTIRKVTLKLHENLTYSSVFYFASGFTDIIVTDDSVIGQNGFDVRWSTKLSKVSIISIINALSDATTGKTITFSQTAKESAFTDEEWATLIGTKPNWTISLV